MQDVLVGLLAIAVGGVFCARGFVAMRILIPAWGAYLGFVLGAGLTASATDEEIFRTPLGWLVGFAVALLLGAIAYLYYEVSIVLALGSIGFTLGASLVAAIGVTWSWVGVLVGAVVGVLLAIWAIAVDLPTALLALLTSLAGAAGVVFGLLLLAGTLDTADLDDGATTDVLDLGWWWYAIFGALAVAGLVAQSATLARLDATWRETWEQGSSRRPSSS